MEQSELPDSNAHNSGTHEVLQPPSRLRVFFTDRAALVATIFLILLVIVVVLAPITSPYDPARGFESARLTPPFTPGHLLGTDTQGRDILSRLIWGGQISLFISVAPALLALPIALFLGLLAGYYGGWIDQIVMRSLDILFAFPMVLLAITIGGALGPGLLTEVLAVGIVLIPYLTRIVYNVTQTIREAEFIEAARAVGAADYQIISGEIMPNVVPALVVYTTSILARIIVVAAGLSFFGLGVEPPTPDWGVMINENRAILAQAPGASIFPGLMIVLVALAFNFIGDGLRDMLDPYLQQ